MFKNFLYLVLFCILSQISYAQNPPQIENIVYRVDTRSPDEIARQGGFLTWSQTSQTQPDNDLASHIEGYSIRHSTSNFVSTSFSLTSSLTYGSMSYFDFLPVGRFYVYRIRPNHNFYDVNASLMNIRDNHQDSQMMRNRIDSLLQRFRSERECASLGSISDDRIIQYIEVTQELWDENRSDVIDESFWEGRWVDYQSYNHQYDNDHSSSQFYTQVNPDGIMQMAINEENGIEMPLAYSCFGSPSIM